MTEAALTQEFAKHVREHLAHINEVLAKASAADFSHDIQIPVEEDEFTETYVGVQLMLEVLREKINALESANASLAQQIQEKNVLLDVVATQRHVAEESQLNMEAILQSITEGIIVVDEQGYIVLMNQAALRLTQVERRRVAGQSIWEILKFYNEEGELMPVSAQPIHAALTTGSTIRENHVVYLGRADGTKVPTKITTSPVLRNGEIIGAIKVLQDVQREKELEDAKSDFVALASHQLRTPLTMINWYIERLVREGAGGIFSSQQDYLQAIQRGAQRITQLVQTLLDVSRLELMHYNSTQAATDVQAVIDQSLNTLLPNIEQKHISFEKKVIVEAKPHVIDAKLLQLVITTLVNNALCYTPDGGRISLRGAYDYLGTGITSLRITVTDTGIGIPQADQAKIFSKLYRGSNSVKEDTQGAGLGLYIVKSMLDYVGGTITFYSHEGRGSTFSVQIPLTKYHHLPAITEAEHAKLH